MQMCRRRRSGTKCYHFSAHKMGYPSYCVILFSIVALSSLLFEACAVLPGLAATALMATAVKGDLESWNNIRKIGQEIGMDYYQMTEVKTWTISEGQLCLDIV